MADGSSGGGPPSGGDDGLTPVVPGGDLPDGAPQLPPPEVLALLPHDDRGSLLIGCVWFMIATATLFLALRLYCKVVFRRLLWWDDKILIAAWVLLIINGSAATYMVTEFGFGKHVWDFHPRSIDDFMLWVTVRATIIFACVAWTKTAFAVTLMRLSTGWMTWFLWFIIISTNTVLMLSCLFPWVICTPIQRSWTPTIREGHCWHPDVLIHYTTFSSSYSAFMDFVLAVLPWKLLWKLQMKEHEKIGVAICMSLGALAGATSIAKTVALYKLTTGDIYDTVDVFLWDTAECSVTIIAISIPILRSMAKQLGLSVTGSSGAGSKIHSRLTMETIGGTGGTAGGRGKSRTITTKRSQTTMHSSSAADSYNADLEEGGSPMPRQAAADDEKTSSTSAGSPIRTRHFE